MMAKNSSGNVLIYILLFTGLLAALTFAITKTGRDSSGVVREKKLIDATLVVQYASSLSAAVGQMMSRGIDPEDIDFVGPGDGAFDTPPNDAKIFHSGGGAVGYEENAAGMADFVYSKNTEIEDIGLSGAPEFLFVAQIDVETCKMLNLHHTGTDAISSISSGNFDDLLDGTAVTLDAAACAACAGKKFLCVKDTGSGRWLYYHVLLDQ